MAVILEKGTKNPEVWFEMDAKRFPGFECLIAYVQPSELSHLTDKATKTERTRGRVEKVVDNDLFARLLAPRMVKNWRGLKAEYVLEMCVLSEASEASLKEAAKLDYDESSLIFIVENAYSRDFFDTALSYSTDLGLLLEAQKKANLKNSAGSSPISATQPGPTAAVSATS